MDVATGPIICSNAHGFPPNSTCSSKGAAEAASWPGSGLLFPEEVARSQLGLGSREK